MIAPFLLISIFLLLNTPTFAQSNEDEIDKRLAASIIEYYKRAPAPLTLKVDVDKKQAASKQIGIAGGSVSLETDSATYTLDIPPDALFYPETISLTAIKAVDGLGAETTGTLAVTIGPSGLPLSQPAWLTIKPRSADALQKGFYPFGFSGDGSNAHHGFLIPQDDGSVLVMVPHFSGFGMGLGAVSSSALGQTKLALPPPDSARTRRDAAAIGDAQNGYFEAAIDALAGDTNTKTGGDLESVIKGSFLRAVSEESKVNPSKLNTDRGCPAIEALITNINGMRSGFDKDKKKDKRAGTRPRLTADQWDRIKACARPPAEACFASGNPWPLVAYIKGLRAYKPEADEIADFSTVLTWLKGELDRCARYKMYITSKSRVPEKLATMSVDHTVEIPIVFNIAAAEAGGKDVFVGKDKGRALSMAFDCKVKGATCTTAGFAVENEAEVSLTLGDLPFDTAAAAAIPGAGGGSSGKFSPKIMPAFAKLNGNVSAQGMTMPLEFEMINSFWQCHYAKEYKKKAGVFEFDGWALGKYPVLYRLDRPKSTKTCDGKVKFELSIELKLIHDPDGQFTPLP